MKKYILLLGILAGILLAGCKKTQDVVPQTPENKDQIHQRYYLFSTSLAGVKDTIHISNNKFPDLLLNYTFGDSPYLITKDTIVSIPKRWNYNQTYQIGTNPNTVMQSHFSGNTLYLNLCVYSNGWCIENYAVRYKAY